jgi:hypothetical protein
LSWIFCFCRRRHVGTSRIRIRSFPFCLLKLCRIIRVFTQVPDCAKSRPDVGSLDTAVYMGPPRSEIPLRLPSDVTISLDLCLCSRIHPCVNCSGIAVGSHRSWVATESGIPYSPWAFFWKTRQGRQKPDHGPTSSLPPTS